MFNLAKLLLNGAIVSHLLILPVTAKILPQYDRPYSKCIQEVFREQFFGTSVSVILPKFNAKISDTFVKWLHGLYAITIVDKNKEIVASPLNKPLNMLFLTSSRLDIIDSMNYLKSVNVWNPVARVLVILSNELVSAKQTSLLNMREMKKIFRVFVKERSIKVNLIIFDEKNVPKIFRWFPFDDENNCSNRVQIIHPVGECLSDGNVINDNFMIKTNYTDLPIVPRTFNKCPLTITAVKMEPYTICDHNSTCDKGIEIRLFESVSRSLNLSLKLHVEDKVDEKVYRRLLRRESDLIIGGINPLTKIRNKRFTQTVPYYQDELTWCVPEAPTINLWLNIFLIFNAETWGYFILTVIIAGTALYYFYKFYHHQENWWYCVAIGFFVTISVSVPINPSGALLRTYFLIFCIYGILVTTTFNSFLMSTIARPMKFIQISTTEGLINNSMQLYAEKETIALYSRDTSELSAYFIENFRICTDINSCLETFLSSTSDNIAVAASREHAMNYPTINESKIYCFQSPENIYVYPVAALSHDRFHLLDAVNHQIQRVVESGLITKWEADSKLTKKIIVHNTVSPFSFHNISGCIVALIVGFTLASIAFVGELYFNAKKKSSKNSQPTMWRVCETIWVTTERNAWPEIARYFRWKRETNL